VGNIGALVGRVTYRKKVRGQAVFDYRYGDERLIRPTLYDAYHEIVPALKPKSGKNKGGRCRPHLRIGRFLWARSAGYPG